MDKEKVLLTVKETDIEFRKWRKCLRPNRHEWNDWINAAQCRKLLAVLEEACTEHEHPYEILRSRIHCPECMAQVEEVLK